MQAVESVSEIQFSDDVVIGHGLQETSSGMNRSLTSSWYAEAELLWSQVNRKLA
jgi:hypothetical protein